MLENSKNFKNCTCFFEPVNKYKSKQQNIYDKIIRSRRVIVKDIYMPNEEQLGVYSAYTNFQYKIAIIRDPRDLLISRFLFHLLSRKLKLDLTHRERIIDLLVRKRLNPHSISLITLITTIFNNNNKISNILRHYESYLSFLEKDTSFYLFKYEDLIDNNYADLEEYLGASINIDAQVDKQLIRVARSKQYNNWKNWFTLEDVEYLKPLFDPILKKLGYDNDWQLNKTQVILPEHADEYVQRFWKEYTDFK